MAPRSYAYSGGERVPYFSPQRSEVENAMGAITSDPREVPAYGVSMESAPRGGGGGGCRRRSRGLPQATAVEVARRWAGRCTG